MSSLATATDPTASRRVERILTILLPVVVTAFALAIGLGLVAATGASVPDTISAFWTGAFGSSYAIYDRGTDTWDLDGVRPTPGINSVATDHGQVLTVGDSGAVFVNRDGTWTQVALAGAPNLTAIGYTSQFVAIDAAGNAYASQTGTVGSWTVSAATIVLSVGALLENEDLIDLATEKSRVAKELEGARGELQRCLLRDRCT